MASDLINDAKADLNRTEENVIVSKRVQTKIDTLT